MELLFKEIEGIESEKSIKTSFSHANELLLYLHYSLIVFPISTI